MQSKVGELLMAYYLKFSELTKWGLYGGITEIEAYMGTTKVPLTALFATSEFDYNWLKEKLVDGDTTGGHIRAWLSDGKQDLQNLLLSANTSFDSIKVYAGSYYNYGSPKDVEVSTYEGVACPPAISPLWALQDKKTYAYAGDSSILTYTHKVTFGVVKTKRPFIWIGGV